VDRILFSVRRGIVDRVGQLSGLARDSDVDDRAGGRNTSTNDTYFSRRDWSNGDCGAISMGGTSVYAMLRIRDFILWVISWDCQV
jgi:hypothetical protein